ncbi:MAG: radical SAM protein [Desulfobacterales bacterium]|nr:radical SAM protein [Desulfobacterales bacterium]
MQGLARKYYRFRPARYYGGIATADLVGCPFLCAYCWNYGRNLHPEMTRDRYYSPQEVANRLLVIVKRKGFNKVRLSGAEPILGEQSFEHLYQVLNDIYKTNPGLDFILETNGLLLGSGPGFVRRLSQFERLGVRVALKGYDDKSFQDISGSERRFFALPMKGLGDMIREGINAWPAIMYEIFGPEGIGKINQELKGYEIRPEELEIEYLEPYPSVLENLKKRSISLHM